MSAGASQAERFCVIGGGILGLATARLLTLERPGARVVVLEKEPEVALHQTGRNSGVVHAGVYYEPGSLKARLCRRGMTLLEAYCAEHGLPYERCGKVVVATNEDERTRLDELLRRSVANGVPGARLLDAAELRDLEPAASGVAALYSPATAITDYGAVARQLAADVRAAGGEVRCDARVVRVERAGHASDAGSHRPVGDTATPRAASPAALLADGSRVEADRIVVCAGLHADTLAGASGASTQPHIVPFRGEYFELKPERARLVRGLIYPVPDPSLPFLGIHLTKRIGGGVLVGPNAVLALGRESYRWRDVEARETAALLRRRSTWRLARAQWRTGLTELRRSASTARFVEEARRYVPELRAADVRRARAGVRAQAVEVDGSLVDDFLLDEDGPIAWVRNAPSPAATSALAIAEELLQRLGLRAD